MVWQRVSEILDDYIESVEKAPVTSLSHPEQVRALLEPCVFDRPTPPIEAIEFVADALWRHQVHTPHPRYFGLFNPAPTTISVVADALVAGFNPQLASWVHSPFAVEVEQHLIKSFAERFGWTSRGVEGTFTSGGAEANHTAVLTALTATFEMFGDQGVRGLAGQPVLYASVAAHDSFPKAARLCGLGAEAVHRVAADRAARMDAKDLAAAIHADRQRGYLPFMVVATAGTTAEGAVDPIGDIADVASREGLWLHIDAAWGGAAALVPELRDVLSGIERADSITFDAHKWLSVPMAAGMYVSRRTGLLERTFRVAADYMPADAARFQAIDPYAHSIQWSRRFIGLKVFLSLLVAGWEGYAAAIRHQTVMGERLRGGLVDAGWTLLNDTRLPLVCFTDGRHSGRPTMEFLQAIAQTVLTSGEAWLSTAILGGSTPALRACITNYRTGADDVDRLVRSLNLARERCTSEA